MDGRSQLQLFCYWEGVFRRSSTNLFPVPWSKGRGPMGAFALGIEDCLFRVPAEEVVMEETFSAESRFAAAVMEVAGNEEGAFRIDDRSLSAKELRGVSGDRVPAGPVHEDRTTISTTIHVIGPG